MIIPKNKKIPKGFRFAVASAGIKHKGRADMGLIVSDVEAAAAGVFTTNRVRAFNIDLNKKKIRHGRGQAIVVNSGNANVCTGKQGEKDTIYMADFTAQLIGIAPGRTFVCSTGVIGTPMPMDNVRKGINTLARDLGKHSISDVSNAIMTTDRFPKTSSRQIMVGGKMVTITASAKGAGMIDPNMATMLCFIITDARIEGSAMKKVLKDVVNDTFNTITVDGDMSTSDTVLMMANGLAGNKIIKPGSKDLKKVKATVHDICYELAEMMVKDGEGATKIIDIEVKGAKTKADARKAADAIANSLLVKTAIYGNDANWGRIIAAAGYSGANFNHRKVSIFFNRLLAVKNGVSATTDKAANAELKKKKVKITIDLNAGKCAAAALSCDLTEEYIRINAGYRT